MKIFDEVCHSCSGCKLICPQKAVTEATKNIGKICYGKHKNIAIKSGFLNIGNASGVPIIKKLLSKYENYTDENIFIDCPPGSACIVMESIKDADFCILVAEPTLFGAHNLQMVYELVTLFNKPCGVVLNKCIDKTNPSEEFCEENKIKIFAKIPFDKTLGKLNSDARILVDEDEKYKKMFLNLLYSIENEVQK